MLILFDKKFAALNHDGAKSFGFVFPLILLAKNKGGVRHSGLGSLLLCLVLVGLAYTSGRAQPYGLTNRAALAPFLNGVVPPASPVVAGTWSAVVAFPNLIFTNAVGLTCVPGTNLQIGRAHV